jgi:hypothetical protein
MGAALLLLLGEDRALMVHAAGGRSWCGRGAGVFERMRLRKPEPEVAVVGRKPDLETTREPAAMRLGGAGDAAGRAAEATALSVRQPEPAAATEFAREPAG